jgi:hypothetical protein
MINRRHFLARLSQAAAAGLFVPAAIVKAVEKGATYQSPEELFEAYSKGDANGLDGHNLVAGGSYQTPDAIFKAYSDGMPGVQFDPAELDRVLSSLKHANFSDAAPGLKGSGKGKISLPYKSYQLFDKGAFTEQQTENDCVSHGTRNAPDVSRAVQIHIKKNLESFMARGATEAIYGARNYAGNSGMNGATAAQFVHSKGGLLLRKPYGKYDLSVYSGNTAVRWGRGIPEEVLAAAREHQVGDITLVTTIEEARDAIANGYGIAVCSNYGFSRTRDKNGFCVRRGSWNHCMTWSACDDVTFGECAFLDNNSWGNYVSGGHPEWGPLPMSSFLIHEEHAAGMLRQRGAWAFSNVNGWPAQELPNYGTHDYSQLQATRLFRFLYS